MRYRVAKIKPVKPGHVRAVEALLAVCRMGLNNPDSSMRVAFAVLAEDIERRRDEWGEAGPFGHRTDKREAAAVAGAHQ